jgi:hypothetical protein
MSWEVQSDSKDQDQDASEIIQEIAYKISIYLGTPEKSFGSLGYVQQRTSGEGRLKTRLCSNQQFGCLKLAEVPERHHERSKT